MKTSVLAILITVLLCLVVKRYCTKDRLLGLETVNYFSSDYSEARRKFIDASHAAGAHIESFENPLTGPEGEPLFTDVALIGPSDASTVLVLGAGTHGVEGFAGSAIQTGLLSEGLDSVQKPSLSIILIHAINPYGFAHLRRFNEDNVDVNRNFIEHSKPYPANLGYEELIEATSPKSISFWANVKSIFKLFRYCLINGKVELRKAISGGQYTDPQGLFYGGQNETWSNKTIRVISKRYLSNAERVAFIDIHTGLGPYGNAEVILSEKEHSPAYNRAVEWWGNTAQTTVSGKSVSVHLQTTLKLAISGMLPDTEVTAVTLEFGTFSALKVFWALREENWLHHYGAIEYPGRSKIKIKLLRMFYPNDDAWKLKVWEQGQKIVGQTLAHL